MKVVIIDEKSSLHKVRLNRFIDWLINMIGYALVLIMVAVLFNDTVQIDNTYFGLWGLLAAIVIYVLNKTIKPILIFFTLPITGLTLGLFYPFINVIILNIVDFILGDHFTIEGIFMSFIVAIFISIMNILMDKLVIEPILRRGR
ncbi:MAG: phage holin family protein [Bacilli bacterium]|nr:phage holin family protein [Bacilli bacterium]